MPSFKDRWVPDALRSKKSKADVKDDKSASSSDKPKEQPKTGDDAPKIDQEKAGKAAEIIGDAIQMIDKTGDNNDKQPKQGEEGKQPTATNEHDEKIDKIADLVGNAVAAVATPAVGPMLAPVIGEIVDMAAGKAIVEVQELIEEKRREKEEPGKDSGDEKPPEDVKPRDTPKPKTAPAPATAEAPKPEPPAVEPSQPIPKAAPKPEEMPEPNSPSPAASQPEVSPPSAPKPEDLPKTPMPPQSKAAKYEPIAGDPSRAFKVRAAKSNTKAAPPKQNSPTPTPEDSKGRSDSKQPGDVPNAKAAQSTQAAPTPDSKDPKIGNAGTKGDDVPKPLADAMRHIDIVAARTQAPGAAKILGSAQLGTNMKIAGPGRGDAPKGTWKGQSRAKAKAGGKDVAKKAEKDAPAPASAAPSDGLPPSLAKAYRAMQIVGARTPEGRALAAAAGLPEEKVTPAPGTPAGAPVKIKAAVGGKPASNQLPPKEVNEKEDEDEKENLPPDLARALRAMQIVGSRTPEGRALAAAAAGGAKASAEPGALAATGPPFDGAKAKVKAAAGAKPSPGSKKDDKKGDEEKASDDQGKDLPKELKASERHMQIFMASQKGGGPASGEGAVKAPVRMAMKKGEEGSEIEERSVHSDEESDREDGSELGENDRGQSSEQEEEPGSELKEMQEEEQEDEPDTDDLAPASDEDVKADPDHHSAHEEASFHEAASTHAAQDDDGASRDEDADGVNFEEHEDAIDHQEEHEGDKHPPDDEGDANDGEDEIEAPDQDPDDQDDDRTSFGESGSTITVSDAEPAAPAVKAAMSTEVAARKQSTPGAFPDHDEEAVPDHGLPTSKNQAGLGENPETSKKPVDAASESKAEPAGKASPKQNSGPCAESPSDVQTTPDEAAADASGDKGPVNPVIKDIIRYRYSHGVNLGSIYVVERWLFDSAFPENAPEDETSEIDCVTLWVKDLGIEGTQKKFEERWAKALSDEDWKWLNEEAHCNAIRLPIGFFTLGSEYCKGTPFEEFGEVYKNGWTSVRKFVETSWSKGIGVLMDLHALSGGANPGEHSGTNARTANLWGNQANLELATKCLEFIAKEVKNMNGIIGIQLCNEARWDAPGMYEWYDKVAESIKAIDPEVPLYISDAWNIARATDYVKQENKSEDKKNPIVADTHIYYCFTDEHKAMSPEQIKEHVGTKCLSELNDKTGNVLDTGASAAIVGEWACALSQESLAKATGDKEAAKKAFGLAQCTRNEEKTGGSYFWTLKMDWMDGGDWGFVAQTKSEGIKAPKWLTFQREEVEGRTQNADSKAKGMKEKAIKDHVDYWSTHEHKAGDVEPGLTDEPAKKGDADAKLEPNVEQNKKAPPTSKLDPKFEPKPPKHSKSSSIPIVKKLKSRSMNKPANDNSPRAQPNPGTSKSDNKTKGELYKKGWELGWNDARMFFRCRNEGDVPVQGSDRIGFKDLWVLKRINESNIKDENLWEFEHGIWKGMKDFEEVALD